MNILGLGGSIHNYSACLMRDGRIVCAVEEERLNRIKYSMLPLTSKELVRCHAASYCLEAEQLGLSDVDLVVTNDLINPLYYSKFAKKTKLINHHLSHAYSAFFTSPFEEAAVAVIDGSGSIIDGQMYETTTLYRASEYHVEEIQKTCGRLIADDRTYHYSDEFALYNSIGGFYKWITLGLGFAFLDDGKTMGLAAYGTDRFVPKFHQFYRLQEGHFLQNREQVSQMIDFISKTISQYSDEKARFQVKADIAFAGQYHLEKAVISQCRFLYQQTKLKNLCLAGGVALNSVANAKILEETPFENLYVFPAAGDAGTAIGSALYGYHTIMGMARTKPFEPFSPFLGKAYTDEHVMQAAAAFREQIRLEKAIHVQETASRLIAEGKVIGWFQGRSEIGPRALGNRSILADPRKRENKHILNQIIKKRESFRPFAPAVLAEKQHHYFTSNEHSSYMLRVSKVRNEKCSLIPAVTHVDGTARLQTVTRQQHPEFYALISCFEQRTGVPIVLNTSFNGPGEPMVESPLDAIQCFLRTGLDHLFINSWMISNNQYQQREK
ncbi:carbamoyltransferase family protein [Brevibacillus migulae]|uniref:carbamoyltransferase family protein n=1 Tax=Brevibacillus migulae TaxID=1644114 RepID=UPI001430B1BF|nr:carbamoyltransferase C-terminal domain-containing protein [Brevibacillus migulae]